MINSCNFPSLFMTLYFLYSTNHQINDRNNRILNIFLKSLFPYLDKYNRILPFSPKKSSILYIPKQILFLFFYYFYSLIRFLFLYEFFPFRNNYYTSKTYIRIRQYTYIIPYYLAIFYN